MMLFVQNAREANRSAIHLFELEMHCFKRSLWPKGTIPVDVASSEKPVIHHGLCKKKEGNQQGN
jgi:hypothetical protein